MCDAAQGFKPRSRERANESTAFGTIPSRRVNASLGLHIEPIMHWFNFGSQAMASDSPWKKRMIEFRFVLIGQTPNGILVRVPPIDDHTQVAYWLRKRFNQDLISAMVSIYCVRLAGLPS